MKIKVFQSNYCDYNTFEDRVNGFLKQFDLRPENIEYDVKFFVYRNGLICVISYE